MWYKKNYFSFSWDRRTEIIRVQVLAKVRETGPRKDEEVNLGDEPALLRTSVQRVPYNAPDALAHRFLLPLRPFEGTALVIARGRCGQVRG